MVFLVILSFFFFWLFLEVRQPPMAAQSFYLKEYGENDRHGDDAPGRASLMMGGRDRCDDSTQTAVETGVINSRQSDRC